MKNKPYDSKDRYFENLRATAKSGDERGRYFLNIILVLFFLIIVGTVIFFVKMAQGPVDDMVDVYEKKTNIYMIEPVGKQREK
ncbi:hypothetical protein MXL46_09205 [Heyndrickxia sporothermodurans]|uniref:hypothetical protein n=1 Tax=Heyndrickxia sporothermodurans TaxID=46224 RepID=UPI002DB7080D|nr:hypothetical protein [Heyndrickxia sporothermodurans]MEB6549270.1 hypothetical protein [Heyndrickxia sporothermodurans]